MEAVKQKGVGVQCATKPLPGVREIVDKATKVDDF